MSIKKKLCCIPYAGKSATMYNNWMNYMDPPIDIIPLELAGRGTRYEDQIKFNINDIVDDLIETFINELQESEIVVFGHSMGGIIAYEFANKLPQECNLSRLIISGINPLDRLEKTAFYEMDDACFKDEMRKRTKLPEGVYKNPQELAIFEKILRADCKALDTYKYIDDKSNLSCPLTIINGKEDKHIDFSIIEEWSKFTKSDCRIYNLDGDHFYLESNTKELTTLINRQVLSRL